MLTEMNNEEKCRICGKPFNKVGEKSVCTICILSTPSKIRSELVDRGGYIPEKYEHISAEMHSLLTRKSVNESALINSRSPLIESEQKTSMPEGETSVGVVKDFITGFILRTIFFGVPFSIVLFIVFAFTARSWLEAFLGAVILSLGFVIMSYLGAKVPIR